MTEADPVIVLAELDDAWSSPFGAPQLAADLLDYARQQLTPASGRQESDRDAARRQRLYAVTQQVYDKIRLAAAGPTPAGVR